MRALRPDAAARWPSLAALLEQLDVLRPRTVRLAVSIGSAVAIAGIIAGVAYGSQARGSDAGAVCGGGDSLLAAVWSPPRQSLLRGEVLATGAPYAAAAWDGVHAEVERWAAPGRARPDLPRHRSVPRAAGPELGRRIRCFATSSTPSTPPWASPPSRPPHRQARHRLRGLDAVACETEEAAGPPIGGPKQRRSPRSAAAPGDDGQAVPRSTWAATPPPGSWRDQPHPRRRRRHPRLRGHAAYVRGLADSISATTGCDRRLRRGRRFADESGDDLFRPAAPSTQPLLLPEDYPTAISFGDARAVVRRASDPPDMVASINPRPRGAVEIETGHLDAAVASESAVGAQARGIPAVDLGTELATGGGAAGQPPIAEAEAAFRRAISVNEQVHGPDHPVVAQLLGNLGGLMVSGDRAPGIPIQRGRRCRVRAARRWLQPRT
jgi:hypothetical protein